MTWRIEIGTSTDRVLLGEILTAQSAWGRLTENQRAAVAAAHPDKPIRAHSRTRDSLTLHGFAAWDNTAQDWLLTEAGKAVAKWCVRQADEVWMDRP
jgi:hypothetical protein